MKKRSDGLYCTNVYLGTGEDGKRRYKSFYGKTQKEAKLKADEYRLLMNKGVNLIDAGESFARWAELWLRQKSVGVGHSQRQNYERSVKKLNAAFGSVPIRDVKQMYIQDVINQLYICNPETGKPASKRLLQLVKQTAQQIFRFAINNRAVEYNPADAVTIPTAAPQEKRRALTPEERQRVLEFDHPFQIAAVLMMLAGLRRGELIALTWDDIDLDAGTIAINKAVEFIGDVPHIKTTKTESGNRVVYFPDALRPYLHPAKNLVLPNAQGEMYHLRQFKKKWEQYLLDMDVAYNPERNSKFDPHYHGLTVIDHFTPHMLRHTFCTLMYESGVDVVTAQHQMGHADVKTTLSIYTHLSDDHARDEMKKMIV
ncbi:MAG: site-specific integrase [Clostridia bacterium]|nr:site-specific integrase [Clostridia bacterium]